MWATGTALALRLLPMDSIHDPRRWLPAWLVGFACLASAATPSSAEAAGPTRAKTAPLFSPARKPAGVPASYVLTHNGFFHPSCVVTVSSGDSLGGDMVVRGIDGAEHARLSPCAYPHFTASGRPAVASDES